MTQEACAHVLVVGGEPQERELAQGFLEKAGYRVSTAAQGDAALDAFSRAAADLVLLPADEGFAICQRLRQLPAGDEAAIVFLTASDDVGTQRRALESGADDCLTRPLQRTELLLRVRSLLRIKQLHEQHARASQRVRMERDSLLALLRRREESIALLVHDMKNPLSGVISNAEFLVAARSADEDQAACAQDILHASRRLHRMVASLLDVSESEQGTLRPELRLVELHAVVRELRSLCSPRLRDKSLTLKVALPEEGVSLPADPDMLVRLLANLVDHAARIAPAGTSLGLDICADAQGVELRVSHSGPSIPAFARAHLFESDWQPTEQDPRLRAWRGIGLSAARALAEAHGGRIWVDDREGEGAAICVRLPR